MFNQLYKLCKRDNPKGKTPLENFTTETFVGILNFNKQVQKDFIELIGLPINDEYEILSQRYYFDDKKMSEIRGSLSFYQDRDDYSMKIYMEDKKILDEIVSFYGDEMIANFKISSYNLSSSPGA